MIRLYALRNLSDREQRRIDTFFSHAQTRAKKCRAEWCYYIETNRSLSPHESSILSSIFTSHEKYPVRTISNFKDHVIEIGPRLNFETPWSTSAVSIAHACGIFSVTRIERSRRFSFEHKLPTELESTFVETFSDGMTEQRYREPRTSLRETIPVQKPSLVHLLEKNYVQVLTKVSRQEGFGWDESDVLFIGNLFLHVLKRNPTDIELHQLAQANSEHSRHWLFRGILEIDGKKVDESLMDIVKAPLRHSPNNSLIAFCDDSSALRGKKVSTLVPRYAHKTSEYVPIHRILHPTLTAETHNFPTGIAPYPGAATGTGGRIRDNEAVGRGGHCIASVAAYCVGNLHIPHYSLPWEENGWQHPENLAAPLAILIGASNGASDYGNRFGEPVIAGFVRTGGLYHGARYRSWFKPVMYTAGVGEIDDAHLRPHGVFPDMCVIILGGPSYRIGIGGGSASSQSAETARKHLDRAAVQRGDPEMGQRLNRVIRACIEMAENNPLEKIVDLGAGGASNALTELVNPSGGRIDIDAFPSADKSLSLRELWINESQERITAIVYPSMLPTIVNLCTRERVPFALVGKTTDSRRITVMHGLGKRSPIVSLPLKNILGDLPQKTFRFETQPITAEQFVLPPECSLEEALLRVLRLPSVGSKRYLTTKVDRSVTGLVARQQCVGPNHLPLADFGIVAQSHFSRSGIALGIGEQPLKGLISPGAGARMAVSEMLLNLSGAHIESMQSIKCSANWMLSAKGNGDGPFLYEAACALRDICIALGIAIDGGKDSLSMSSNALSPEGNEETVLAPPQLVITGYAPVPNVREHITPDIKERGSSLILIDPSRGGGRIGGSALCQVFGKLGDSVPDIEDPSALAKTFEIAQFLIKKGLALSIHDRSDGGLITAALEMAFAGNTGLTLHLNNDNPVAALFSEEAGLIVEVRNLSEVSAAIAPLDYIHKVHVEVIGTIPTTTEVEIFSGDKRILLGNMPFFRAAWEETSARIDLLQANPVSVASEQHAIRLALTPPPYNLTYTPTQTAHIFLQRKIKPAIAILREEGSNGDREMASAFFAAGFEPHDVTMTDLLANKVSLNAFRGIAFVGGFSFADVPEAGTGWASIISFNPCLQENFKQFYARKDTFSIGVCNGCQLMAQLGWVGPQSWLSKRDFRFIENSSGRFESRFSTVCVEKSPSIFFTGMTGSVLGIWVAHGEGRIFAHKKKTLERLIYSDLVPLQYIDLRGNVTEEYPHNPNGSPYGIAAVCSPDGRHLAIMPHPERTFITWQWPWVPESWKSMTTSPWMRLFQNAHAWSMKN